MDKFTVEQVERCLARREYELVAVKRHYGPEFVQNPHYDETNAMLRAYAARLREDALDTKMLDFLDAHPKLIVRSGEQAIRPLILAAMYEQGEG